MTKSSTRPTQKPMWHHKYGHIVRQQGKCWSTVGHAMWLLRFIMWVQCINKIFVAFSLIAKPIDDMKRKFRCKSSWRYAAGCLNTSIKCPLPLTEPTKTFRIVASEKKGDVIRRYNRDSAPSVLVMVGPRISKMLIKWSGFPSRPSWNSCDETLGSQLYSIIPPGSTVRNVSDPMRSKGS